MPMSFKEAKIDELQEAFGNGRSARLIYASPEAGEDAPFNAWIAVAVEGLTLRVVRDRDREHIDVECAAGGETKRWVSLEILAVALDWKSIHEYKKAFEATLKRETTFQAGGEDEAAWVHATMLGSPLECVAQSVDCLREMAGNAVAIRAAEVGIAKETAKLLTERAGGPGLR